MNNRMKILLAILGVMILIMGGQQYLERSGRNKGGTNNITQVKNVNRDHLRISTLYPLNYTLKSVDTNPFDNPLAGVKDKTNKESAQTPAKPLPPEPPKADVIPVTPPVMQRNSEESKKSSEEKAMKLKAIAHSGDRSVAVVEYKGKTVSVFVGGAVGNYIVTDISDNIMTLQNFSGETITLEVAS